MKKTPKFMLLLLLGLLIGCAGPRYVDVSANTEPCGAWIYKQGSPSKSYTYTHRVSDEERQARKVRLPSLVFKKPGYFPYVWNSQSVAIDSHFWNRRQNLHNSEKVYLIADPDYPGPEEKNRLVLTVNSQPQGARVYINGWFYGMTPLGLNYTIENQHYRSCMLRCTPIIVVHDGCLPSRQDLELMIEPEWRYTAGQTHEYGTLFLLERDPDYRPPVVEQGQTAGRDQVADLKLTRKKDDSDVLQRANQIEVNVKFLQPIR